MAQQAGREFQPADQAVQRDGAERRTLAGAQAFLRILPRGFQRLGGRNLGFGRKLAHDCAVWKALFEIGKANSSLPIAVGVRAAAALLELERIELLVH